MPRYSWLTIVQAGGGNVGNAVADDPGGYVERCTRLHRWAASCDLPPGRQAAVSSSQESGPSKAMAGCVMPVGAVAQVGGIEVATSPSSVLRLGGLFPATSREGLPVVLGALTGPATTGRIASATSRGDYLLYSGKLEWTTTATAPKRCQVSTLTHGIPLCLRCSHPRE